MDPSWRPQLSLLPGPLANLPHLLPQKPTRPFPVPLPSPFMAFRSALASASGLKLSTGRTVPFSCKKQKETQQVSGGPPGGPAKRGACKGGEAFPTSSKPSSFRGKRQG